MRCDPSINNKRLSAAAKDCREPLDKQTNYRIRGTAYFVLLAVPAVSDIVLLLFLAFLCFLLVLLIVSVLPVAVF